MFRITLFSMLFFGAAANATDLAHFHARFQVTTNAQGHKVIIDRSLNQDSGLVKYVQNLATFLKPSRSEFDVIFPEDMCKGIQYEKPNEDIGNMVETAIGWMQKTQIGNVLTDPKFIAFLQKVNSEGNQFVKDPDYQVMANLDSPKYFYKKAAPKFFLKKLKGLAEEYFTSGNPYLKVVTFVVNDYTNWVGRSKAYHQNYLRFYLETQKAEDLGLTESERLRALSSIEDSELSFGIKGIIASNKIEKDFEGYGAAKLADIDKEGEKRWSKYDKHFEERISKLSSHHSLVNFEGSPIYVNVVTKKSILDKKLSFAFDAECPLFQYQNRRRYELARVALSIFPIPYSDKLSKLFRTKYETQSVEEGFLYAHLESENDTNKSYILKQSVNPLLQ